MTVERTPLGRYGTSSDISKAIAFLASTDAEFMTGSIVDVDGGLSLVVGGTYMNECPLTSDPKNWSLLKP